MNPQGAKLDHSGTQTTIFPKANSVSSHPGKTAHHERPTQPKSFVSSKTTAHDERFGFERRTFHCRTQVNARPKRIPPPTSKIQNPTSILDHSLGSYVIVVSIQSEASIRSFFLRVRKEGVW
jgi:hypothetical protein